MKEQRTGAGSSSSSQGWAHREEWVRGHLPRCIPSLVEDAGTGR